MKQEAKLKPEKQTQEEDRQDAYSSLRRDIIELRLKPGTIVSIRDLCEHFRVSRSPMRDALIRLGQEGLIDLMPQRGIRISQIDLKRVEEERFLRISVEKNVMQVYMTHCAPEDAALLETSVDKQKQSIEAKDYRRNISLDDEFHKFFYRAAGKPFCADVIWKASGHYSRIRLLSCVDRDIIEEVTRQHYEMVDAIKAGDAEKMLAIFNRHLSKIGGEERFLTQKYPDLFLQQESVDRGNDLLKSDFLDTLKI